QSTAHNRLAASQTILPLSVRAEWHLATLRTPAEAAGTLAPCGPSLRNDSGPCCSRGNAYMSSTFETVAGIISETCDIPREKINPDSHAINDLGIDSLDFLDVAFAIDKAFGIKMPLEQWTQEVNEGKVSSDRYFVMKDLCTNIDKLVAAKAA